MINIADLLMEDNHATTHKEEDRKTPLVDYSDNHIEIADDNIQESKLSSKDRNELDDNEFGIPEDRKFPLNDKNHVEQAIRMFGKADEDKKKSLAKRISKKAKEYNIDISNTKVNEYLNETVETRLTKPFIGKEITLYHGSSEKLDIISPISPDVINKKKSVNGINLGTRFSKPRYSSFWCDNDVFPKIFTFHREVVNRLMEKENNKEYRDVIVKYFRGDYVKEKFYIRNSDKSEFLKIFKSIKIYIHKVTVDSKIVGRGHHKVNDEYSLDIPVKPDEIYDVDWNDKDIQNVYNFIDDNKFDSIDPREMFSSKYDDRPKRGWNIMYDLVYHDSDELKSIKKSIKNIKESITESPNKTKEYDIDISNTKVNEYLNETYAVNEKCKDLNSARKLTKEVRNLAKKYDANFYFVTDGASATNNNGNQAVKVARDAVSEWERNNGFDDKEDWEKDSHQNFNSKYLEKKDFTYNLNKWNPNKYNILFITGMSGSGKTTLGIDLAKINKCQRVELDYIIYHFLNKAKEENKRIKVEKLKKDCSDAVKFFTSDREAKYSLSDWGEHIPVTKDFLDWFVSSHEGDGNLYIINGTQIADVLDYEFFKERPIIIKDPNLIKNVTRRTKRESRFSKYNSVSGWIQGFIRHTKLYFDKSYRTSVKNMKSYIKNIKESITESSKRTNLYPVYIVTSYTNTVFGKIIRKATDSTYTHAAISFEPDLQQMYSFGNSGNLSNSKWGGMTCESLQDYLNTSKDAKILVSVVFVKEKDYHKLISFFEMYLANHRDTRYDYKDLVRVLTKKVSNTKYSLYSICSQFVDSLFKYIGVDLTGIPSNLVTPKDIAELPNNKPTVYMIYEGPARLYTTYKASERVNKLLLNAVPIKELALKEAKEFPIQFNNEGDLLISKKEKIDFLTEYNKSKKLRYSYVKYKNLEGLKYEASKLWYINTILMKLLETEKDDNKRKDLNNYRSKILTEFSQYLKDVQKLDNKFNFGSYYEQTPFSNTKIKINGSTIKYTTKLLKTIFK